MILLKKTVYDKLAAKVNNIDTSAFVFKTKYQTEKTELEKKIPDVTDLVKKTSLNQKTKLQMLVVQQQRLHRLRLKIK